MSVLALSGWGQHEAALSSLAPTARHYAYAHHVSLEEALDGIARAGENCRAAIGWSLGGMLLARAVAEKRIRPEKLVLVAAPYRFVRAHASPLGMPRDIYAQFLHNFARDVPRTLKKAHLLVAHGDARALAVMEAMPAVDAQAAPHWRRWLELLGGHDCEELDFSGFPPTLLLHGTQDAVVGHNQAEIFARRIPQAHLISFEGCGHAPHWHDTARAQDAVNAFLS